jgi:hypothetical protein
MYSTCTYVNDISSTTLGGIVEEMVAYPLPTIQIPPKSCHFAIEKGGFLFFFAHSGMNDFDLVKEVTHGSHRLLPLTKAFGVGANQGCLLCRDGGSSRHNVVPSRHVSVMTLCRMLSLS